MIFSSLGCEALLYPLFFCITRVLFYGFFLIFCGHNMESLYFLFCIHYVRYACLLSSNRRPMLLMTEACACVFPRVCFRTCKPQ